MKQVDAASYKSLLTMMSPALRGEVSTEVNVEWTNKIACLRDCPSSLLIELALHMDHLILPPAESIVWPVRCPPGTPSTLTETLGWKRKVKDDPWMGLSTRALGLGPQ